MPVACRQVGDLVHDRTDEVYAAPVIVERMARFYKLLDIKTRAEIKDLYEQVMLDDADF